MKGSSALSMTLGVTGCLMFSIALAQLRKPTAEDLSMRGPTSTTTQTAAPVVTIPPSADPRDISGTWSAMDPARGPGGGMAAGGAGGMAAGGGGGPADGAPGAAPGGAPGGAGGAAMGAGAGPGGGAPGGAGAGGMGAAGAAPGGAPAGAGGAGPGAAGGETGNTRLQCFPSFTSFGGVEGVVDILQTERVIVFVGQEMQLVRRIYMNVDHPKDVKPSFFGDSVGKWDGDTLVVDTVGIRNGNSTRHVVERIRKINGGQNLEAVMVDPTTGAAGRSTSVYWNPTRKLAEWICEDADEFWKEDYR
ncbi:MAG: hypothetical protein QM808_03295 [Steroidobacteraceae bacterium]